jgi:putative acetyltransferase
MVTIRRELPADIPAIRRLNDAAFGGPTEGAIVDALRARCPGVLSLVAVEEERIVGHIFFSPVAVEGLDGNEAMGLGPMAVAPERQRQGIGSALAVRGLEELERSGCALVVALGHPGYYPRFGFVPAARNGLRSQWDGVPDEAFMVRFLKQGVAGRVRGVVHYRREFEAAVAS